MPLVLYPQLKNEIALPVYVTGIGISCSQLTSRRSSLSSQQLLVTVSGCGTVTVKDKAYILHEGCGIYLDSGVDCHYSPDSDSPWIVDWITFDITSEKLKNSMFTGEDLVTFEFNRPAMISEDIRKMLEAVSRDESYGGFFASSILYSTLIELNRETLDLPAGNDKGNNAISAVIDYINGHFAENITLEELCGAAGGLSEQYFCRLFKQHTGTRPIEYILRKRIGVARSYLEETDMPIVQIAEKIGFNNTSYFYRNFKKFMGMSPLTCRQNALYRNGGKSAVSDT